jgi:hypothetical protein
VGEVGESKLLFSNFSSAPAVFHTPPVMSPGKKRASPGAEVTKNGTSANKEIELSPGDSQKLIEMGKEMAAAELVLGMQRDGSACLSF